MATMKECRAAIDELADRLSAVDPAHREKNIPDRTLSLHLLDHDALFVGDLHRGALTNIRQVPVDSPRADIRLSMSSDDLIALTNRELSFPHAWATGRVRLDASIRDLLRLRRLG